MGNCNIKNSFYMHYLTIKPCFHYHNNFVFPISTFITRADGEKGEPTKNHTGEQLSSLSQTQFGSKPRYEQNSDVTREQQTAIWTGVVSIALGVAYLALV